jgi:putative acetyltransferase
LILRPGTTGDAPFIQRVHEASIRGAAVGIYSRAELESWATALHMDRYIWAMNFAGQRYILAEVAKGEGGKLAGFCSWSPDRIVGLYIHPAWAGRGVATALMNQAEEAIIAAAQPACIHLAASAPARPFYEKRGYRVVRQRDWKTRGGLMIAAFDMEKPVSR